MPTGFAPSGLFDGEAAGLDAGVLADADGFGDALLGAFETADVGVGGGLEAVLPHPASMDTTRTPVDIRRPNRKVPTSIRWRASDASHAVAPV